MRKFLILFLTITLFCMMTSVGFAAKRKKLKKKKSGNLTDSSQPVKYTGSAAKRDPFGLPQEVMKLLEKPESLNGVAIVQKQIEAPSVNIQGIIWSKRRPQVIIDGSVMKVGDFIKEFEIKEITRKSVILFFKGKTFSINVINSGGKGGQKKR